VNVIGAYFSHGPLAGEFPFVSYASLPRNKAKQPRKSADEQAAAHGLRPEEVGTLDAEVFLAFLWTLAGKGGEQGADWRRERPLMVALDNYSVHKSERVKQELPALTAADIHLVYLPAYSPELSAIEPIWRDVKYHGLPERSYRTCGGLKRAVDRSLAGKAIQLREAQRETILSSTRPT
jgi:hypothetical protein